jgi:hypothetical protein
VSLSAIRSSLHRAADSFSGAEEGRFLALLEACELLVSVPLLADGAEPEAKPPYNFYALRHAAASLFIEQGWSPKGCRLLWSCSTQVTFDIYGHLFPHPPMTMKAMARIEARLLG